MEIKLYVIEMSKVVPYNTKNILFLKIKIVFKSVKSMIEMGDYYKKIMLSMVYRVSRKIINVLEGKENIKSAISLFKEIINTDLICNSKLESSEIPVEVDSKNLLDSTEDEKYFLKKDLNVIKAKIKIITEKPIIPVSVRISK